MNISLKDGEGRPTPLKPLRGRRATVIAFMGVECPVGNLYMPRLSELARKYEPLGVAFVIVNSNGSETGRQVAEHARLHGIRFPALKDADQTVADLARVDRTCEVLLLDDRDFVAYRGAIDDQYAPGRPARNEPTHRFLADAIDAVLANRPVVLKSTEVFGCPLEMAGNGMGSERSGGTPVTYADDIAPIIAEKCQGCHRPGESAPFSLTSYDQSRRWARGIREAVTEQRMPPWQADPRYGRFKNDRSLSPEQRAKVLAWIDQGSPAGDLAKLAPPKPRADGQSIGTLDLIIPVPKPFQVPAEGAVRYHITQIPDAFAEDTWVQAIAGMPGERSVVHHISIYVADPTVRETMPPLESRQYLFTYVPGCANQVYPPGTAKFIPAHSNLVIEIHYTANGYPVIDRSSIGFKFAHGTISRQVKTATPSTLSLVIPPRVRVYPIRGT